MFNFFKSNLTKNEVKTIIENFLEGKGKPYDWDDFVSVPIIDDKLEEIRKKCSIIHEQYPPTKPNEYCNDNGAEELKKILRNLDE